MHRGPPPGGGIAIAVCFFGITRSLSHVRDQLEATLVAPLRAIGKVRLYGHFFDQAAIDNPRTGEAGELVRGEWSSLAFDRLETEPPNPARVRAALAGLKPFGDYWQDDFRSLSNLAHQLHSLDRAGALAAQDKPDAVVFARPDLFYHDRLDAKVYAAATAPRPSVWLPSWQHWQAGYNDRFAVCSGGHAARIYASRLTRAGAYCSENGPLHSEKLLRFSLNRAEPEIGVRLMRARASRVRSNGAMVTEDFHHKTLRAWITRITGPCRLLRRLMATRPARRSG